VKRATFITLKLAKAAGIFLTAPIWVPLAVVLYIILCPVIVSLDYWDKINAEYDRSQK
jgi:hypothetical protein